LFLSAAAVIVGAIINAETERQTARDSTIGEVRPRGERGAVVADYLPGERNGAEHKRERVKTSAESKQETQS
jgi:membrane protein